MVMSRSFLDVLKSGAVATGSWAVELFREIAPKVAFFFVVFLLIFLMFKLFVAQYSIEFSAFTKASVAALILGKVIALLDRVESGYRFAAYRRIVVVAIKTLVYASAVIVLGIGDRILRAARSEGSFREGINALIANANVDRFLGLVVLITFVVGAYLTIQEIDRAMGKGALVKLFFEKPLSEKLS
jgi:hypothetical protein